jgi:transposase
MVFYYGYNCVLVLVGMICPIGTYPSPYQTCHRRFQQWVRTGVFEKILQALSTDLRERGGIDLSECYIDGGTFIVAKKRGNEIGRATKRGKGTKLMAISDNVGLPISIHIASASPHEVTLAEATLSKCFVTANEKPERLIGEDKAYDSDPLDERLAIEYGIEMISPHRFNRHRSGTQDGRSLRRYKRRWKIEERLFAWLHNFRRIPLRYEYHAENYLGLVQLGCITILLRRCL